MANARKKPLRKRDRVSIVVSAYNEETNVEPLYEALINTLNQCELREFEVIFVNDGSRDQTLEKCLAIALRGPRVRVVNLARNFGHEIAMTAGMDHARFEGCIFMDCDFQHPPELIPKMLKLWQHHDLVLTRRLSNHSQSLTARLGSKMFYRIFNILSAVNIPHNTPDFRLLDRKYVDIIMKMNESERLFRGLLNWIGASDAAYVDFAAPRRRSGESKYNFKKSFALALDSILQFSIRPLRLSLYAGLVAIVFAMILGLYTVWSHFAYASDKTGYATTIVSILFVGSIQLIVLGIIGEYVGRIHIEVKRRPLYVATYISGEDDIETNIERG